MNLEATWEESSINTPLIGLLSMGSDPTSAIEALAKRKDVGKRIESFDFKIMVSSGDIKRRHAKPQETFH